MVSAEDFQFIFPVVGPLTKPEFIKAFSKFEVRKAFPSAVGNFFNFCVRITQGVLARFSPFVKLTDRTSAELTRDDMERGEQRISSDPTVGSAGSYYSIVY